MPSYYKQKPPSERSAKFILGILIGHDRPLIWYTSPMLGIDGLRHDRGVMSSLMVTYRLLLGKVRIFMGAIRPYSPLASLASSKNGSPLLSRDLSA